ncbi:type II CAAX prenyl endopeptidase Rce1 family protein [Flavobacterium sp. Arc2]|jgi:membrane protease YdiL (CAAX protease family)|uniref:CPBP family glutamic-type intramembrane protease n=1 Tax=Flavobacterium sp. Arc2 TaxID=3046685 RepID=UPI00352D4C8B
MQMLSNKFLKKDWTFDFIYLFLILIVINIVFLISTYLIFNKPLFQADDLKLLRTPEKLLMAVIIIPIIEEFSMRGLFVVNNKLNIILWTLCLIAIFFTFISQSWVLTPLMLGLITLSLILFFNFEFRRTFNRFISNYFLFFLCLTSIVFGLLHLSNYPILDTHTVLKIFPRILGGFYLGYIANKYGIKYSILMHCINNTIPLLMVVCYQYFAIK